MKFTALILILVLVLLCDCAIDILQNNQVFDLDFDCQQKHNIYALDVSGLLEPTYIENYERAIKYIKSQWSSTKYASLFEFGLQNPDRALKMMAKHEKTSTTPPVFYDLTGLYLTDYNSGMYYAKSILQQKYQDRTCVIFVSDGLVQVVTPKGNEQQIIFSDFLIHTFKKLPMTYPMAAGCNCCVKCYDVSMGNQYNQFHKFCDIIGASYERYSKKVYLRDLEPRISPSG